MYSFAISAFKLARKCNLQRAIFYSINNGSSSYNDFERPLNKDLLVRNIKKDNIISRKTSKISTPAIENIMCQVESIFKDVQMKDMAQAPTPSFWYNAASLAPIVLPSLSFILTGFHPNLFNLQMTYGALLLAFQGGAKLGNELEQKEAMNWENISWAVLPISVGWMSLILPDVLSPLVLSAGFLLTAFADLTLGYFPAWYKAARLAFVIPALVSLFIAFFWNLFY